MNGLPQGSLVAGKYRVEKILARGGFSTVYRGIQEGIDRTVALKILPLDQNIEATWLERFTREAKLISQLDHPNTITIYDYGQQGDAFLYIVMEYVRGRSLSRQIRKHGPLEPVRVAQIAIQICGSLEQAHGAGILHRDLKPSNIMLTRNHHGHELAKVLDFGVAKVLEPDAADLKLTQQGTFIGTPRYASPEAIRRQALDQRADVYGVGMVMW